MADHLRAVVDWTQSRYQQPWQKDVLRRVVEQSGISDADRAELIAIVEVAAGIQPSSHAPAARALALPAQSPTAATNPIQAGGNITTAPAVVLGRLHGLKHVNALASGQQLTFAEKGLTLIYGENGAGKTGYSRVLRRACRQWREKDVHPIMPSVRQGAPTGTPEATFDIRDGSGVAPRSVRWVQGGTPPTELVGFAVLDSSCIRPLIADENIISYQPQELGILPAFASLLTAVHGSISAKITGLRTKPQTLPQVLPNSPVGTYLARLDSGATIAELDALVGDVTANEARQTAILQDLALLAGKDGPESRAQSLDRLASRADEVRKQLAQLATILGDEAIQKVAEAERDHRAKRAAAQRASQQRFQQGHLTGTGTADEWKALYEAAKAYSEHVAYPGKPFPMLDAGAQCPLCQQDLDTAAVTRLRSFHAFVEDRTATDAVRAQVELERVLKPLRAEISDLPQATRDEVRGRSADLGAALDLVAAELRQRQTAILKAAESGAWTDLSTIGQTIGVIPRLAELVATVKVEAVEKRKLVDPARRKAIEAERDELTAKLALHKSKADIARYLNGIKTAKALEISLGDCGTTALSTQNGKFSEQFITRELAAKLNEELRMLGVEEGHLAVEFKTKTERGITRNSLVLTGTTVNPKEMHEVLSEGEQRVLAIAAFLAELRLAERPVGVIFDDPVTSLDHRWADRIAERLVRLGEDRQVILFTHHISFSYLVRRHAERLQASPLHEQFICRVRRIPGNVSQEPVWEFMPVKDRKVLLNARHLEAQRAYTADPDGREYQMLSWELADLTRSTWERAVEEDLLNGSLRRFTPDVQTSRLREVEVTTDDFKKVFEAMTLLSSFIPGHDRAAEHTSRKPTPAELKAEIDKLFQFSKDVIDRRDRLRGERRVVTESAPAPTLMPAVTLPAA